MASFRQDISAWLHARPKVQSLRRKFSFAASPLAHSIDAKDRDLTICARRKTSTPGL
jgi:hypothetical protein